MYNVGDKIRIIAVSPDAKMNDYVGREGVIDEVEKDPWGYTRLHGTWGGCWLYLNEDIIEKIKED